MVRPMEDDHPAIGSQFEDPDRLNVLLPQLEVAVESAMVASSGRAGASSPAGGGGAAGRRWGQQRVLARLEVVRGVPFYGYHGEEKLFVKVDVTWWPLFLLHILGLWEISNFKEAFDSSPEHNCR